MKIAPLFVLASNLLACAALPPPLPTPQTGTMNADQPPTPANSDLFLDAIRRGDDDGALGMLATEPTVAHARTPSGNSAYLVALLRVGAGGFVKPANNRIANAILAHHPALSPFESVAAGDVDAVDAEIAKDGSFVTRVHPLGWMPLHFAAFGGQARVVKTLLSHGAAVDAVAANAFGNTPLQVALLTQQGEVARILVAHGANVNFHQKEGVTALHEAAQNGDPVVVQMLLDAGADPQAKTGKLDDGRDGVSPAELARKAGHEDVARLIEGRFGVMGGASARHGTAPGQT